MPCDLCDTRCYVLTNLGREPCPDCAGNGYQIEADPNPEPDGYWYEAPDPASDLRLDTGNLYPWTWPDLRYQAAEDDRFFSIV